MLREYSFTVYNEELEILGYDGYYGNSDATTDFIIISPGDDVKREIASYILRNGRVFF